MAGNKQSSRLELPPSTGTFNPSTPSGLTPNTRSEAEAALTLNVIAQTDSAAPVAPLLSHVNMALEASKTTNDENMDEAQKAWRRPAGLVRTSSTNYEEALKDAYKDNSLSSVLTNLTGRDITGAETVASPISTTTTSAFPPPGQGVVPIHTGVGTAQAKAIERAKPTGLTLGALARQQSWNAQDLKHVNSANLMEPVRSDAGYASEVEGKDA